MIRYMTEQDMKEAAAIYACQRPQSGSGHADETLRTLLSDREVACFLWKENNRCEALLITRVVQDGSEDPIVNIEYLITAPQYRNRKIGSVLAAFCDQKARLEGMQAITAKPGTHIAALRLARHCGFQPCQNEEGVADSLWIKYLR